jgi:hypothetical protein
MVESKGVLQLFFCYRWILINFKREFVFEDVLRLWEVKKADDPIACCDPVYPFDPFHILRPFVGLVVHIPV